MCTVSIITPCYNSSGFFEECLRSVYSQSFKDWEMIIIDDASLDNSYEQITSSIQKNYQCDNRFKVFKNIENLGAAETRNYGLEIAKGRFIAFLDIDDVWLPTKLEEQLNFMKKQNIALSFHSYLAYDQNLEEKLYSVNAPSSLSYMSYIKNTCIGCLTVMIDLSKTGKIKMPNIRSSHDMALWLDILEFEQKAYGLDKPLAIYRTVSSSNTAKKWKAAKDVWFVIHKYKNHSLFQSFYFFLCYSFNAIKKRFL